MPKIPKIPKYLSLKSSPNRREMFVSLTGSGLDKTLRLMCTVCRSLEPVGEVILLGVARISYIMGLWSHGTLKFKPGSGGIGLYLPIRQCPILEVLILITFGHFKLLKEGSHFRTIRQDDKPPKS